MKDFSPKHKTILSAGILAAACMLALSGCGSEKNESKTAENTGFSPSMDKDAEAQIHVQGSWSNFEALEAAVEDWNESPSQRNLRRNLLNMNLFPCQYVRRNRFSAWLG